MTREELFRLREKHAQQSMFEHNYFITPKEGIGVRCFVDKAYILSDIIDHLTQLKIHYYKCCLYSSLN